jgi:hypothetical protein
MTDKEIICEAVDALLGGRSSVLCPEVDGGFCFYIVGSSVVLEKRKEDNSDSWRYTVYCDHESGAKFLIISSRELKTVLMAFCRSRSWEVYQRDLEKIEKYDFQQGKH